MDSLCRALATEAPLPISLLSELGKGSLRNVFANASGDLDVSRLLELWPKLISTAKSPQVVDKHITSASNALCVFLNGGASSHMPRLRSFAISPEVWLEGFQCAHKAFNDGKTKPAFQIMDTLCGMIQKMTNHEVVTNILAKATLPLIQIVLRSSPRSELKKACLILSCLCRKTPTIDHIESFTELCLRDNKVTWMQRLSEHNISLGDVTDVENGSIAPLLLGLIFAMINLDTRTAALKLYSALCSQDPATPKSLNLQVSAERFMELFLERNHEALGDFAENVLPVILSDKGRFLSFMEPYASSCHKHESRMAVFLAALKVGRMKSILSETGMSYSSSRAATN